MQRHVAAHKPRQIGCVGFVGQGRVTYLIFCFVRLGRKQFGYMLCGYLTFQYQIIIMKAYKNHLKSKY